jgi:LPXTG-motif cell wall-anchored protein
VDTLPPNSPEVVPAPAPAPWYHPRHALQDDQSAAPPTVQAANRAAGRDPLPDQSHSLIWSGVLALMMAVAGLLLVGRRRRQW